MAVKSSQLGGNADTFIHYSCQSPPICLDVLPFTTKYRVSSNQDVKRHLYTLELNAVLMLYV